MAQRALLGGRRGATEETRVLEHGAGSGRDFTWGVRCVALCVATDSVYRQPPKKRSLVGRV